MKPDIVAQEEKKRELANSLQEYITTESDRKKIIDKFEEYGLLDISAPMEEELIMEYININSRNFHNGGTSRKAGNITLNFGIGLDLFIDISLILVNLPDNILDKKVKYYFILLHLCREFYSKATITITTDQAIALCVLWENRDSNRKISENVGYNKINEKRKELSLSPISNIEYKNIIDDLIKNKNIELTDGVIWLREWVKIKY